MGDAAGELADQLHLLLLRDLVLELALLRRLQHVDDGRFLIAFLFLDRGDVEAAEPIAVDGERGVDRRDVALAQRRLANGGAERVAIAFGDDRKDGAVFGLPPSPPRAPWNSLANSGLVRTTPPCAVDGGDRHRGVWKNRMKRISAARSGSVPSSRARLSTSEREAPAVPSEPKASL